MHIKQGEQRNSASSVYTTLFPKNEFISHRVCKGHPGELWDFCGKIEALGSTHSLRRLWAHSEHLPMNDNLTVPTSTVQVTFSKRMQRVLFWCPRESQGGKGSRSLALPAPGQGGFSLIVSGEEWRVGEKRSVSCKAASSSNSGSPAVVEGKGTVHSSSLRQTLGQGMVSP